MITALETVNARRYTIICNPFTANNNYNIILELLSVYLTLKMLAVDTPK